MWKWMLRREAHRKTMQEESREMHEKRRRRAQEEPLSPQRYA
jgi:hypothetical protein